MVQIFKIEFFIQIVSVCFISNQLFQLIYFIFVCLFHVWNKTFIAFCLILDWKLIELFVLQIIRDAQKLSARMNHRGACACDNDSGDGAGVLSAIPHQYYADEIK